MPAKISSGRSTQRTDNVPSKLTDNNRTGRLWRTNNVDMDHVVIGVSRQASVHDAFSGSKSVGMFALRTPFPNSSIVDWSSWDVHPRNLKPLPQSFAGKTRPIKGQGPKDKRLKTG